MDDLHDRLERLAKRIEDRAEPLAQLQRVRARRTRTRRLSAATLALVVGVAGILGVVRAFDDIGDHTPQRALTWRPPDVLTIWPEGPSRHVTFDPTDVQAAVDVGTTSLQWRTDPREVALRFAESVLSWEVRSVSNEAAVMDPTDDTPVRSFRLSSCPRNAACKLTYIQDVYVVQPAREGAGGIWSVGWVRGDDTSPEIAPGEHLAEHELIRFSQYPYHREVKKFFGLAWFNGCVAGRTAQRVRDDQPTISLSTLSTSIPAEGCSPVAAGIAFSVRSDEGFVGGLDVVDPFAWGAEVISVVPFTFDLPTLAVEGTLATYTDQFGWSIDYPADWSVLPIDGRDGRSLTVGAAFSDGPLVPSSGEGSPWPDPSKLSSDQVVVMVIRERFPPPMFANDSSFPLQPINSGILDGGRAPFDRILYFRGDGLRFALWWGSTDRDSAKGQVMEQMIRTIRFEPWTVGERRNGWDALGSASDFTSGVFEWRELDGGDWLLIRPGERREAFGYVTPPCPAPDLSGTEQVGVMRCPDGSENGWDARAEPLPGNDPNYAVPLERFPVITSWDGYLLIGFGHPGCQGVCE